MMKTPTGSRLPSLTLPDIGSGAEVKLRSGRGALVLLTVHSPACADCIRLVEGLGAVTDRLREWGGRVLVVVPGDARQGGGDGDLERLRGAAGDSIQVLADPEEKLATGTTAAIAVADEWGEVYFGAETVSDHRLASPQEVLDWVRFVVIQCPECEGPEGEWRTLAGR